MKGGTYYIKTIVHFPERFKILNLFERVASCWRLQILVYDFSTFAGRVLVYHDVDGCRGISIQFQSGSLRICYHIRERQQARKLSSPDSGR